jgi:hypothetical protein
MLRSLSCCVTDTQALRRCDSGLKGLQLLLLLLHLLTELFSCELLQVAHKVKAHKVIDLFF